MLRNDHCYTVFLMHHFIRHVLILLLSKFACWSDTVQDLQKATIRLEAAACEHLCKAAGDKARVPSIASAHSKVSAKALAVCRTHHTMQLQ